MSVLEQTSSADLHTVKQHRMTFARAASAMAISIVLLILINIFILYYDLEGGLSWGIGSVPPAIPWFVLLVLLLLSEAARKIAPKLMLDRRQMLLIFGFLALAIPLASTQGVRSVLPHISVPQYYAEPDNEFGRIAQAMPTWLVPNDAGALIYAYEGSPDGRIMWGPWLKPLALWTLFMMVLGLMSLCWIALLRNYWDKTEHLSYPMLELPRRLVNVEGGRSTGLLNNPLMWIGFGLAFLFEAGNILKYFNPGLPAIPSKTDLAPLLNEEPWRYMLPLRFYISPVTIGAAYLVPSDILFSTWSIYLIYKVVSLIGGIVGVANAGPVFPYYQEQATGGYIAYGILILYASRNQIAKLWSLAWQNRKSDESYPLTPAWAVFGLIAGAAFVIFWCHINQFALKLAIPYFSILLLYTVVQARIRAETGVPLGWNYPYGTQKTIFDHLLGAKGIMNLGGEQGLIMMSNYFWLARYNFLGENAQFQTDNVNLWQKLGIPSKQTTTFLISAMILGITIGFAIHMRAYYHAGASLLQGGTMYGGANTNVARWEYLSLGQNLIAPGGPDATRTRYIIAGFILTPLLALIRTKMLNFPFHPLGFLLATSYGPTPYYWSSFMLAWIAKTVILWLGGARAYRVFLPLFLGIVLGSTLSYDVLWMIIRALLPEGMVTDYV